MTLAVTEGKEKEKNVPFVFLDSKIKNLVTFFKVLLKPGDSFEIFNIQSDLCILEKEGKVI
jgi:hypothetical protein